jgi:hypothetical protein
MAIASISSVKTITPQTTTPAQADAAKSADSDKASSTANAPATAAPTVLTQGGGSARHHKKIHHPLPGQPGYQVNKKA